MSTTKNYIKGLYAKNRESQYGTVTDIDFTDEAIDHLKSLPKNAKGYRKLTMTPQKNDASKLSVYENTYIPKSNAGDNSNSSSGDEMPF